MENKVEFLLDKEDSVQVYEESGKIKNRESHYEMGMKALASLDHVQQVNVIEGIYIYIYNIMKKAVIFTTNIIIHVDSTSLKNLLL